MGGHEARAGPAVIAPFRRPRRTVGVDVGSARLKVAVVDHSRGAPRLEKVGVLPVGPEPGRPGNARRQRRAAGAIRSLFEEERLPRRGLVCAVGGRDVIVKLLRLDRGLEGRRGELRREAARHVPFDAGAVETDVHVVDRGADSERMTVLLVAAKRAVVRRRLRTLEVAGLEPRVVDAEALALHNCLEFNHPEAMEGVVALACIGSERTALNVVEDGTPVLARDVGFGTRDLRRALAVEHGMGERLAEEVVRGAVRPLSVPVAGTIRRRVAELARAVDRASSFLQDRVSASGVGALYLCGGGIRIPRLRAVLADRLGVEILTANPLQLLEPAPGALDSVDVDEALPLLAPAVGMGLRTTA